MDKTIFVATRHAIYNQGSILQAIATEKYLEDIGYNVKIIDYVPEEERFPKIIETELKNNESWNNNFLKRFIFRFIKFFTKLVSEIRFSKYQGKYLSLTKKIRDAKKIEFYLGKNAIFCSGSDQIWGPIINGKLNKFYFLNFTNCPKISFSSSVGRVAEFGDEYIDLLQQFDFISLRDASYVNYFKERGLKKVFSILDPTMMIEPSYWMKFAKGKKIKNDYMLYYRLHKNEKMEEKALEYARKKNIKLIRISNSFEHGFLKGKNYSNLDPADFIGMIKNAKYIISDSFHCTVFSLIFNKNFITVSPGETALRVVELLKMVGLNNRYCTNLENCFDQFDECIDYNSINKKIENIRKNCSEIFKKHLYTMSEVTIKHE